VKQSFAFDEIKLRLCAKVAVSSLHSQLVGQNE